MGRLFHAIHIMEPLQDAFGIVFNSLPHFANLTMFGIWMSKKRVELRENAVEIIINF